MPTLDIAKATSVSIKPGDWRGWLVPAAGGTMLLLVGCALLADQLGYVVPYRWLFLVLLVPAAAAISDAVRIAPAWGWLSVPVLSRLIAATVFALIGMSMFLGFDTGLILPGLIMALGAGTILRTILRHG